MFKKNYKAIKRVLIIYYFILFSIPFCYIQAIKELSKSRLQRQQQNDFLRITGPRPCFGLGVTSGQESLGSKEYDEQQNKRRRVLITPTVNEIEVLKLLDHPNIIQFVQAIDDPESDSIYLGT